MLKAQILNDRIRKKRKRHFLQMFYQFYSIYSSKKNIEKQCQIFSSFWPSPLSHKKKGEEILLWVRKLWNLVGDLQWIFYLHFFFCSDNSLLYKLYRHSLLYAIVVTKLKNFNKNFIFKTLDNFSAISLLFKSSVNSVYQINTNYRKKKTFKITA